MNDDENYLVITGRLYLDERGLVQRNGMLYAKWLAAHERKVAETAWDQALASIRYESGDAPEFLNNPNPYRANQLKGRSDG